MKSGGLCSHFVDARFIVFVEMQLKVGPSMFGVVLVVPCFDVTPVFSNARNMSWMLAVCAIRLNGQTDRVIQTVRITIRTRPVAIPQ
jgi:hypothetical protein